jgi:hypothetical protein
MPAQGLLTNHLTNHPIDSEVIDHAIGDLLHLLQWFDLCET